MFHKKEEKRRELKLILSFPLEKGRI